jgi:hypothetical protein
VPSKRYKVVGEFLVGIGALEVAKDSGGSKDKKDD